MLEEWERSMVLYFFDTTKLNRNLKRFLQFRILMLTDVVEYIRADWISIIKYVGLLKVSAMILSRVLFAANGVTNSNPGAVSRFRVRRAKNKNTFYGLSIPVLQIAYDLWTLCGQKKVDWNILRWC